MLKNELKKTFTLKTAVLLLLLCLAAFLPEILSGMTDNSRSPKYAQIVEEFVGYPENERLSLVLSELETNQDLFAAFGTVFYEGDPEYKKECEKDCIAIWGKDYREVLAGMDLSEEAYIRLGERNSALRNLRYQLEYLSSYEGYLDTVHANTERISRMTILQTNEYVLKNALQTGKDYPEKGEIQPELTPLRSFSAFWKGNLDLLCSVAFAVYLAVRFAEDKKNGLKYLLYGGSGGRAKLTRTRILVLLMESFAGTLLLSGLRLYSCVIVYGSLPGGGIAVQSCELFQDCVYPISFAGILLLRFLSTELAAFLFGCFCYLVFERCRNFKASILICVCIVGLEYLAFTTLTFGGRAMPLKVCNLFAVLRMTEGIAYYWNVNLFGFPVQWWIVALCFGILASVILVVLLILVTEKNRPIRSADIFTAIGNFFAALSGKFHAAFSAFLTEIRKSQVFQHGCVALILFVLIVSFVPETPPCYVGLIDKDKNTASLRFVGPVTEETVDKIAKRDREIKTWADRRAANSARKELREISDSVLAKLEADRGLWVVNEAAYASLYTAGRYQSRMALFALFPLVFLCACLFPYEEQNLMNPLLSTSAKGKRKSCWRKIGVVLLYSFLLVAVIAIWEILRTERFYGNLLTTMTAPVQSMEYFSGYAAYVPFWLFTAVYYLKKVFVLLAAGLGCCLVTCRMKNVNAGVLVSFVPFLLPSVFSYFGADVFSSVSLSRLWSPLLFSEWVYAALIPVCVLETVGILHLSVYRKP